MGTITTAVAVVSCLLALALMWWIRRLRRVGRTHLREIQRLQELAHRRADQISVLSHEVRTFIPEPHAERVYDRLADELPTLYAGQRGTFARLAAR